MKCFILFCFLKVLNPTTLDNSNVLFDNALYHGYLVFLEPMIENLLNVWIYIVFRFVPVLDHMHMNGFVII